MKRWTPVVLAVVAAVAALAAFAWFKQPPVVEIARPHRGEAVQVVYATGFVEPEHPVSLSSRITAPVLAVNVDEGQRVRRGEVLIALDAAEQRSLLAQVQAQRRAAEQNEARIVALFREGWTTRAVRDEAVAAAAAARALASAGAARVGHSAIRAPFDGIVLKREVEPGDLAAPGTVLMQIGDPREIRITTTVDERDILGVRPGQEALLSSDALGHRVLRSVVYAITPGGDPNQRAFRVRLRLTDPVELPFGLTLEANIVTQRHERALLVPAAAYADGRVWTVDNDQRARRRRVRAGIVGAASVEILGGLTTGDRVIVNPPANLAEGARVRLAK